MSAHTPIQWCDSTVNPTSGCDGCELHSSKTPEKSTCYARQIHETRFALQGLARASASPAFSGSAETARDEAKPLADSPWVRNYAPSFDEVRIIPGRVAEAAKWGDLRGKIRKDGTKPWLDLMPRVIFVGDLSDIFSLHVSDAFLEREVFAPMESEKGQRHVWIVLTKRPSRLADFSIARGGLPRNCLAMTSVTSASTALSRMPELLRVRCSMRGVSAEPLWTEVNFRPWLDSGALSWIIVGGESGSREHPCALEWLWSVAIDCQAFGVSCFIKQLGAVPITTSANLWRFPPDVREIQHGDAAASARYVLRDNHGGDWNQWPDELCVRNVPDFSTLVQSHEAAVFNIKTDQ